MFRNYLKSAFRSLWKTRTTSFINVFGLSIGMAATVFIFLWVQNEAGFDSYHQDKEQVYRITNTIAINASENWIWENSPMLMAETALREIPEVEQTSRVIINTWGGPVLNINNKLYAEKTTAYVDKNWFNIFNYTFKEGNAVAFSQDPFSIIITESKAKKFFGNGEALGQIIKVDTTNYTVKAVVEDNPTNSSFQFDIMLQMGGRLANTETYKNDLTWNNFNYITFVKVRKDADIKQVNAGLNNIIKKNRPDNNNNTVSLVPLTGMYFETDLQSSVMPKGSKKTVYIFSVLGILLLLTACINYVNLTTAKASLRAKEVSVRKIIGANRSNLFAQFIAESLTVSIMALVFTIILLILALPVFNEITGKAFDISFTSLGVWKILVGTLLFAALLNGIYPALLLSSFKPLNVFRGISVLKLNDGTVRKGLVVFQFTLSMILIVGTIVIYKQLNFIQTTNPGYNVAQVLSIEIPYPVYKNMKGDEAGRFFQSFKNELSRQQGIVSVSGGSEDITNVQSYSSGNADWDGRDTSFNPSVARLSVDADFKSMFNLQMVAGRWFTKDQADDRNYILNETAAAEFNMHKPILGQRFIWGGDTGQVVGIVKDFHYKSMHEKIGPMVLMSETGRSSHLFVKLAPGSIPGAVSAIQSVWASFISSQPLGYTFMDDGFNMLYSKDIQTSKLILIFSFIAVIIAALGLFALSAFTAEQCTKEIGIRKVLGASVQQITTLLSKDFIVLVCIAILIATPFAWWAMNNWLQDFAYRIDLGVEIFFLSAAVAIFIALLSVSYQAIKAALANPAGSLRTE